MLVTSKTFSELDHWPITQKAQCGWV